MQQIAAYYSFKKLTICQINLDILEPWYGITLSFKLNLLSKN